MIVNRDTDDGWIIEDLLPCTEETLTFEVTVLPEADRSTTIYFNLLIDWDQDGKWEGYTQCAPTENFPDGKAAEWAIQNLRLDSEPYYIGPGLSGEIVTPAFLAASQLDDVWIRATVTTVPIDVSVHVPVAQDGPGWDGSGMCRKPRVF